jgi:hypothetical protein
MFTGWIIQNLNSKFRFIILNCETFKFFALVVVEMEFWLNNCNKKFFFQFTKYAMVNRPTILCCCYNFVFTKFHLHPVFVFVSFFFCLFISITSLDFKHFLIATQFLIYWEGFSLSPNSVLSYYNSIFLSLSHFIPFTISLSLALIWDTSYYFIFMSLSLSLSLSLSSFTLFLNLSHLRCSFFCPQLSTFSLCSFTLSFYSWFLLCLS